MRRTILTTTIAAALAATTPAAARAETDTLLTLTQISVLWLRKHATCRDVLDSLSGAGEDHPLRDIRNLLALYTIEVQAEILAMSVDDIVTRLVYRCDRNPGEPFLNITD